MTYMYMYVSIVGLKCQLSIMYKFSARPKYLQHGIAEFDTFIFVQNLHNDLRPL